MKRYLPILIIAGVLAAAIGGGAMLMKSSPGAGEAPLATRPVSPGAAQPQAPQAQTPPAALSEPPARIRGVANAPVTLDEFSDFQCPTCAFMHTTLKQLLAKYPTQVRLSFRHYPLRQMHPNAAQAALAAEAAGQQGKFWEMHDLLYEKQAEWGKAPNAVAVFSGYARSLGLDAERFTRDMTGTAAGMRVMADERLAVSLGLTGTPSFFINGRPLPYEQSNTLGLLSAAVERELAAGKK